tara:strand:+ start:13247 stop:13798 length:552 start_codon:yes stop_codon:yes gene_type:complete
MALQSSGAISLNEIHIEAGGSTGSNCTINDSDIRGLISKSSGATMSFNEWYGASANDLVTSFTFASQTGKYPWHGYRTSILGSTTDANITVSGTTYTIHYFDEQSYINPETRLIFGTGSTTTTETPFGTNTSDTGWNVTRSGGGQSDLTADIKYANTLSGNQYKFTDDEICGVAGTFTITFSN